MTRTSSFQRCGSSLKWKSARWLPGPEIIPLSNGKPTSAHQLTWRVYPEVSFLNEFDVNDDQWLKIIRVFSRVVRAMHEWQIWEQQKQNGCSENGRYLAVKLIQVVRQRPPSRKRPNIVITSHCIEAKKLFAWNIDEKPWSLTCLR